MTKKIFIVFIAIAFVSCSKHKIIPENTLAEIIYEMNVVDAVLTARETRAISDNDSVRIYEPIVEKYGYSLDDLRMTFLKYTVKDGKLQSVLKKVSGIIETEKNIYKEPARIEKLSENMNPGADSIRIVLKKASKQNIEIRLSEQGVYDISASYFFYKNDSTKNPKMEVWLESKVANDSIIEKQEINLVKDSAFNDYSIRVNFNNPKFNILKIYWLNFDGEPDLSNPIIPVRKAINNQVKKTNAKIKPDTITRQNLIIRRKSVKYNFKESDTTKLKETDMFTGPPTLMEFNGKNNITDSVTTLTDTVKRIIAIKRKDSLTYGN
jgi:hypothetical protein